MCYLENVKYQNFTETILTVILTYVVVSKYLINVIFTGNKISQKVGMTSYMVDIHSHLVFRTDYRPLGLDEALKMIYEAEEVGVGTIFVTPHIGEFQMETKKTNEIFGFLADRTADCGITLLMGYEVRLNPIMINRMVDNIFSYTLGGSEYMLVEFPDSSLPVYSQDIMSQLQLKGIIPIIVHPEMYMCFVKDPDLLAGFTKKGCMIQLDAASLLGLYGNKCRDFALHLITSGNADFIASNAHSASDYSDWYLKAYWTVIKQFGRKKADELFHTNAEKILDSIRCSMIKQVKI